MTNNKMQDITDFYIENIRLARAFHNFMELYRNELLSLSNTEIEDIEFIFGIKPIEYAARLYTLPQRSMLNIFVNKSKTLDELNVELEVEND